MYFFRDNLVASSMYMWDHQYKIHAECCVYQLQRQLTKHKPTKKKPNKNSNIIFYLIDFFDPVGFKHLESDFVTLCLIFLIFHHNNLPI